MNPELIIQSLIKVVQDQDFVFSPEVIATLPDLKKSIAELENAPEDQIEEAIREWMINHKYVRDAVLMQSREIKKVEKSKPENIENTLQNQCRILQEEIEKLENRKKQKS